MHNFWYIQIFEAGAQVGVLYLHAAFMIGADPEIYVFGKPLHEEQVNSYNVDHKTNKGGYDGIQFNLIDILSSISIIFVIIMVEYVI